MQHALLPLHSPLEITPHNTSNGEISITCRNRHCPKCQSNARDRWLEARRRELLPVPYAHVVFTLPGQLAALALQNKGEIYGLLFRSSAETLLTVARDEKHLGADIGFFSVLHTWTQAADRAGRPVIGWRRSSPRRLFWDVAFPCLFMPFWRPWNSWVSVLQ